MPYVVYDKTTLDVVNWYDTPFPLKNNQGVCLFSGTLKKEVLYSILINLDNRIPVGVIPKECNVIATSKSVGDLSLYTLNDSPYSLCNIFDFDILDWAKKRKTFTSTSKGVVFFADSRNSVSLSIVGKKMYDQMRAYNKSLYYCEACKADHNNVLDFAFKMLKPFPNHMVSFAPCIKEACFFVNDSTKCPPWIIRRLNQCDCVVTPSQFSLQSLLDSGLTAPSCVWNHSIGDDIAYTNRDWNGTYRFLFVGTPSIRKGTDLLLRAFNHAFLSNENVELWIKDRQEMPEIQAAAKKNNRIKIINPWYSDISDLYSKCHCLVFPSRCEGFGMPPWEAAFSGMQVITTAWSGMLDYKDKIQAYWLDPVKFVSDEMPEWTEVFDYKGGHGLWCECSEDQLIEFMRKAEKERKGQGPYARNDFTFDVPNTLLHFMLSEREDPQL